MSSITEVVVHQLGGVLDLTLFEIVNTIMESSELQSAFDTACSTDSSCGLMKCVDSGRLLHGEDAVR